MPESERNPLSRECMIILLCLELSRHRQGRLFWPEQLDFTFNEARRETLRLAEASHGIFPRMFMDIARLLCVTTRSVVLIRSESSMSDAITQSWPHILKPENERPRFIVCVYDGEPPFEFLIITTDSGLVQALSSSSTNSIDNQRLNDIVELVRNQLESKEFVLSQRISNQGSPESGPLSASYLCPV